MRTPRRCRRSRTRGPLAADKEAKAREAFANGELSLDRYELRKVLAELGVEYRSGQ